MLTIGKTSINIKAAFELGEANFKATFKGKLDSDLNEVWKKIVSLSPTPEAPTRKVKKSFQERLDDDLEKKSE
jgi:hypothetical protein